MTREDVKQLVQHHNNQIDNFINKELPQLLITKGVQITFRPNGEYEIPLNDWFMAQSIIQDMNFYKQAMQILEMVRPFGYNVKINMQTFKLV